MPTVSPHHYRAAMRHRLAALPAKSATDNGHYPANRDARALLTQIESVN
jgi:hypothetical protein